MKTVLIRSYGGAYLFCLLISLLSVVSANCQVNTTEKSAYVDEEGILRWRGTEEEIHGFGTNYTTPFAHAYRTAKRQNIDLKKAIDDDVYHFARLGFDLYRVHVWDTEISDSTGNLLENEHLELFDYLIKKLKKRDINFIITPIAYWGNGWPEPDEDTPGFSNKYGKENSLTNPEAIKAQENYLAQFANHKNKYTGVAYKNEPNLIAFEISNEPHHQGTAEEVTDFVSKMQKALRSSGTNKPIFYNVSHSIHLAEAYFEAGIDGGTFQWYPTGLGFSKELKGNYLPNVDEYRIPFDAFIEEHNAAKIVYEFDPADVLASYMYPAMARSFRTAGIQLATQFAYDPTFMAYANTEYDTHYMNLAYTPQKALSLAIASRVFHEIPMEKSFGSYPKNRDFDDFSIDYEQDLAVYNAEDEFIYTNTNAKTPKSVRKLKHISGYGNSEIVRYNGTGAYFLDRLKKGVWRLEVMPDAVAVQNPLGANSPSKKVTVINWKTHEMSLKLTGLGPNFSVKALNSGNDFTPETSNDSFNIRPGTYLVKAASASFDTDQDSSSQDFHLNEFSAPESNVDRTYLRHKAPEFFQNEADQKLQFQLVSNEEITKVEAYLQNGNTYESISFNEVKAYQYEAELPKAVLKPGFLSYRIIMHTEKGAITYPAGAEGSPADWDFFAEESYRVPVRSIDAPFYLFNAATDSDELIASWQPGNHLLPGTQPGQEVYKYEIDSLLQKTTTDRNGDSIYDYSVRYAFPEKITDNQNLLQAKENLVVAAQTYSNKEEKLQVALLLKNGKAYGKILNLTPGKEKYLIKLTDLKPVQSVLLPRPYPGFQPYYFESNSAEDFSLNDVEALQFSVGPGLSPAAQQEAHRFGLEAVYLE